MSIRIELSASTRKLIKRLQEDWGQEKLYAIIDRFFQRKALIIAGNITRTFLSGQRLKRRTGALARGVIGLAVRIRGVPAIKIGILRGPSLAYAATHEYGGVIKPTGNRKNLAIPQEQVLTSAGVDRYGGPRNFPGKLHFVPFKNRGQNASGALLDDKQFAKLQSVHDMRKIKIAYLLVRQVKIKAKRYLRDGLIEGVANLSEELGAELKRHLVGAA